jgi:mannosyltransferase OCH1-like enzyme
MNKNEYKENSKNWKDLNPNWNYHCIDDKFLEKSCLNFSKKCYNIYKNLKTMHMKIDLGRYVVLYLYGGIYSDMDAYILRSLNYSKYINKLIDIYENTNSHILGLSKVNTNLIESYFFVQKSIILNNAVMISSKNNPVLKNFIKFTLKKIQQNKNFYNNDFLKINNTTGPIIFNQFFSSNNKKLNNSKIIVFDSAIFEPCDLSGCCKITNETICIHLFEKSWIPTNFKLFIYIYSYIKPYFTFVILFTLVILLLKYKKMNIVLIYQNLNLNKPF